MFASWTTRKVLEFERVTWPVCEGGVKPEGGGELEGGELLGSHQSNLKFALFSFYACRHGGKCIHL